MIAGQQDDGACPGASLEFLQQPLPPLLFWSRFVEQVTRAEHGVHVSTVCQVEDAPNHFEPRPRQAHFLFGRDGGEPQAQVPIGSVEKLECHVDSLLRGHAITNSRSKRRSACGGS